MDKQTFLRLLQQQLSALSPQELQKHIEYYSEMIDDRIEDGLSEQEAVAAMGDPSQIAQQILSEAQLPPKQSPALPVWAIVLLVVGSPIWVSLLIAAFSVVISLYVSMWAVLISLYTIPISLGAASIGCMVVGFVRSFTDNLPLGIASIGAALLCAGLCMFSFWLCNQVARGILWLTRWSFKAICSLFRKEAQK